METSKILFDINEDIKTLRTEVFIIEQNVPVELEIEDNEDKYIHCCIYKEGILIAYARVYLSNPAIIGRVCVRKNYRKLGYGKKIMKLAEKEIKGINEIHLHAQTHAKGFYEALGYTPFGDFFLEAGIRHISMKKTFIFQDMNTLSMMTGLTTRTLRNYIKLGLLHGQMVNGKWQFSEEEIHNFFKEKFVEAELIIKSRGMVNDYLNTVNLSSSCFIVDLEWNAQLEDKIRCILDIVNQENFARFSYLKISSKTHARLCVIAKQAVIKNIINIIEG
ncbi:MAG: GNAT family N-acetyltransferase [Roseburia sp.]|nr:GNAT family N-acetyltransferase [Anaeroplasma bactoclasticum]MCM1196770.1 GNAT family N-acetyltransferase [Roseburia sp.]MCM1557230.1 GNAT family N-acetyltransferase [Anaeroplasma bactoclasticum]